MPGVNTLIAFLATIGGVFVTCPDTKAQPAPGDPPDPQMVLRMRMMLNFEEADPARFQRLVDLGEKGFPYYEVILADPKSEPIHVANLCGVLCEVKADRQQFIEPTVQRLADDSATCRRAALRLLAEIGSEKDTAPVVALLSDDDIIVRHEAAKTLAAIGGPRDLVAMNAWLKSGSRRDDKEFIAHVKLYRDDLAFRLSKAAKKKDKGPHNGSRQHPTRVRRGRPRRRGR